MNYMTNTAKFYIDYALLNKIFIYIYYVSKGIARNNIGILKKKQ